MSALAKAGAALAALHVAFLLFVMYRMSAGGILTDPMSWLIALWAVAPVAFLGWRVLRSSLWLIALIPVVLFGTYAAYDMSFVSESSTAALGLIVLPIYEWAFIGLVGMAKLLTKS